MELLDCSHSPRVPKHRDLDQPAGEMNQGGVEGNLSLKSQSSPFNTFPPHVSSFEARMLHLLNVIIITNLCSFLKPEITGCLWENFVGGVCWKAPMLGSQERYGYTRRSLYVHICVQTYMYS